MRKKSLFIKIITSFVVVLIITLSVFYAVMEFKVFPEFEREIVSTNIGKLTAVQNNAKNMIDSIDKTVLNLSFNDNLNRLQNINTVVNNNTDHIFLVSDIISSLVSVLKTNDSVSSILLYAGNCDYVFSSNKEFEKSSGFEYNQWIKDYKETNEPAIYNISENPFSDYNNIVTFVYPLSKFATTLDGAVAVNVSKDYIRHNILSRPDVAYSNVLIFDDSKNLIMAYDMKTPEDDVAGKLIEKIYADGKDEGYVYTEYGGGKCIAVYVRSNIDDWTYVDIYPLKTFLDRTNVMRFTIILTIIALIILGLLISYLLSTKIYSPIKVLTERIKVSDSYTDSQNEIETISNALDSIIQQNKDITAFLENNRTYIRNTFIENLLDGVETDTENYELVGIEFLNYHCCALISIDKYGLFSQKYDDRQRYHMKMLICDICEKAFDGSIRCYAVVGKEDRLFLLISMNDKNDSEELQCLEESLISCQRNIRELTGFSVTVTLGDFTDRLEGIKKSYNESIEAVKFRIIAGYDSIIPINQYKVGENSQYFYPYDEEKHLFNQLLLNDENGVREALKDFFDAFVNRNDLSYENIIYIYNQLLGSAIKFFNDNSFSHSYVLQEYSSRIKEDLDSNTFDEINCHILDLFVGITQTSDREESCISSVIEYIENNYKTDIDVNTLAESTGISYSHLRKLFRERMGMNLTSFINKRRIKEAKILLKETDMTIYDMATHLGYNSDQTFTRFFKKYEGTTPGVYRSAVRDMR